MEGPISNNDLIEGADGVVDGVTNGVIDVVPQITHARSVESQTSDLGHEGTEGVDGGPSIEGVSKRYTAYIEMLQRQMNGEAVDQVHLETEYEVLLGIHKLKEYIQVQEQGGTQKLELRGRQLETLKKIAHWLEAGGTKGYIVMPTGCGKTVVFLALAEALGLKTFVCEPTAIIQDQVLTEIDEKTGLSMEDVVLRNSRNKGVSGQSQVTVSTYGSVVSDVKNARINEGHVQLIIRDEVHKSLGEQTSAALNLLGGIQIGFTATEDYEYKNVRDDLPDEIDRLDPIDAIKEGMMSGYKNYVIGTDIDLKDIKFDGSAEDSLLLERAVDVFKRNIVAVKIYTESFKEKNSKGICFCSGITHSQNVADLFVQNGISAMHIDGETSVSERRSILQKYKDGEIQILTCSDVLIEGFDEKEVEVVFNLAPSRAKVRIMQRAGRALRKSERSGGIHGDAQEGEDYDGENNPKVAYIYDFEDKESKAIPYGYYLESGDTSTLEVSNILESGSDDPQKEQKARKEYESMREQVMSISKGLQTALNGTDCVVYSEDMYSQYLGRINESLKKRDLKISVVELKEFCESNGINSERDYKHFVRDPQNKDKIANVPLDLMDYLSRKNGTTIKKFFGKEITATFDSLMELCRQNGITTSRAYEDFINNPENKEKTKGWPRSLKRFMIRENKTIAELFGKENRAKNKVKNGADNIENGVSDVENTG